MIEAKIEELRCLLRDRAIIPDSVENPLGGKAGQRIPWIYYHWNVGLNAHGLRLAAEVLLDKLRAFEGVQLAAYGLTSLPLVSACVVLGGGRFSGLAIRKEPEKHGTKRQIDGVGDRSKPVVIIDDCLGTGRSLHKAMRVLEQNGYQVEGTLALVNFPWKGGAEWGSSLGLKVVTLFDAWRDLEQEIADYVPYNPNHTPWRGGRAIAEGLSPVAAAKEHILDVIEGPEIRDPPRSYDQNYGDVGGVFVSVRHGAAHNRLARNGFFVLNAIVPLPVNIARAAIAAGLSLTRAGISNLEGATVSVSLLGPALSSRLGDADFSRYAVVARSTVQPWKIGCALPNTQFFASEIEQINHALFTNAKIGKHEPYRLSLHSVRRFLEPGDDWPPFGGTDNATQISDETGEAVVRSCSAIYDQLCGENANPVISELEPIANLSGVAVSLYWGGKLTGCWIAFGNEVNQLARRAVRGAKSDNRFVEAKAGVAQETLLVSILLDGEWIGKRSDEAVARRLRLGRDTLAGGFGEKWTAMLAHVACHHNWSAKQMVSGVKTKAKAPADTPRWRTYKTVSFLGGEDIMRLQDGVVVKPPLPRRECIDMITNYLVNQCDEAGIPAYIYWPHRDQSRQSGTLARKALALSAIAEAADVNFSPVARKTAKRGFNSILKLLDDRSSVVQSTSQLENGIGGRILLLIGLSSHLPQALEEPIGRDLMDELVSLFHPNGLISPMESKKLLGVDHDLLPGVALLALAKLPQAGEIDIDAVLPRYLNRFRLEHSWGLAWWHMQAWAAWHLRTRDSRMAEFVFEMADWVVARQLSRSGAFLVDYARGGPGFHSACVLEGLASAISVAVDLGDRMRAQRYTQAFSAGHDYVSSHLLVRVEDSFCLPNPKIALGGVREGQNLSRVRIDFPAHYLKALASFDGIVQTSGEKTV